MAKSDTSCLIEGLPLLGQVWTEFVCHDVTPQLWRKSEGKRSIQGDNCNKDVTSTAEVKCKEMDGGTNVMIIYDATKMDDA